MYNSGQGVGAFRTAREIPRRRRRSRDDGTLLVFVFGHFLPMNEQSYFIEHNFIWW